jgi:WD40 repeat protein
MNKENCINFNWDKLLERIESKNIIRVNGQDIYWIENDHEENLLYDYLAEKLTEEVEITLPCASDVYNKLSKAAFEYIIIILGKRLFSPDSTRTLTISSDVVAKLWDLKGNMLADFDQHTDVVKSAVFSPDGKLVLTASEDGTAKLWDLQGNLLSDLKKHTGPVNTAVFSPDGTLMLTASADGTAKLWYTPEAIIDWLKKADIPPLSKKNKDRLGLK